MLSQTSCALFEKYGSILKGLPKDIESLKKTSFSFSNKQIDNFYINESDTIIRLKKGIVLVVVSTDNNANNIESFILNRKVKINKNVYYNFISISNTCKVDFYCENQSSIGYTLDVPYKYQEIVPNLHINKIYTKFYQEKPTNYLFKGEKHSFWELTFVDRGVLYTDIDSDSFKLNQGNILFYAPNQYHNQYTDDTKPCCYLTVSFDMNFNNAELLSNRVFNSNKDIYRIITSLMKELELDNTYSQELALCYIKELILKLLKPDFDSKSTSLKLNQCIDNSLFDELILFIENNIEKQITIPILCDEFNISSSKLHLIFKENLNTSAKLYINKVKLKKSKELMSHSNYTVGEVALMVGFNSIHYFSNKFKKEYGFSPKEYINSIRKT